jgi:hypothetical protein
LSIIAPIKVAVVLVSFGFHMPHPSFIESAELSRTMKLTAALAAAKIRKTRAQRMMEGSVLTIPAS